MKHLLKLLFKRNRKEIKYVDYLYYHDRKSLKTNKNVIDECTITK